MDTLSYKTSSANKANVTKKWLVINAANQVLGRLASQVAVLIRGKQKSYFTPHVDCGDQVIIINADQVRLTGKKWSNKRYITHTGYPGGQRVKTPLSLKKTCPDRIVEHAVRGMLPKTRLGRRLLNNLFVYAGATHPHQAQKPTPFNPPAQHHDAKH